MCLADQPSQEGIKRNRELQIETEEALKNATDEAVLNAKFRPEEQLAKNQQPSKQVKTNGVRYGEDQKTYQIVGKVQGLA